MPWQRRGWEHTSPLQGHSVWGMLNAPATGEAMSELILDGAARHLAIAPFAPGRLPPLDPKRLSSVSALSERGTSVTSTPLPFRHR